MKNKYYYDLLEKLISKYERRFLSFSDNVRKITIKFNEKELNDYVSSESYKYRSLIENAVDELVSEKIIDVYYERGKVIDYISLNRNNIDKAYKELNKDNILSSWNKYLLSIRNGKSELSQAIYSKINSLYNERRGIKLYFNDYKSIEKIIHCIDEIENNKCDILLRDFSTKVFNDSKYLENNLSTIRKYYNLIDLDSDSDEVFLEKKHIYKNPISVVIKGDAVIKVNNQIINLKEFGSPLHLYKCAIDNISFLEISSNKVVTIENKTTFFDYTEEGLIIYLAGFPNSMKIDLLKKIAIDLPNTNFYHFGDIDLGGFRIYNYLCEQTGIDFNTKYMDINTLIKYKSKLTRIKDDTYFQNLESLKQLKYVSKYSDVVNYMIENRVVLEQEILYR